MSAISAALQRKTFTYVRGQTCYPNTYVLLVGPPGVGKGNAMKRLSYWLRNIDGLHISPDGITKRAFFSTLEAARCEVANFNESASVGAALEGGHHSLSAFIEELGVFLHPGDNDFIYALCHVYDTPPQFHYKTETSGENFVENVYFSMLSAVTPKGLKDIFTDQALELGISARTVIIYSDEKIKVEIFGKPVNHDLLEKDLRHDLDWISKIQGEYIFDNDAAQDLVDWGGTDFAPVPKDTRFEHYNSRRFVQIVKMCMVVAAARRQETLITREDLAAVKTILLEAERVMPEAVKSIGANPYVDQQQLAVRIVNDHYNRNQRGIPESVLRRRLATDMDPRYADMIYDDLAKAKWVDCTGEKPSRVYYPRGKMKSIILGEGE